MSLTSGIKRRVLGNVAALLALAFLTFLWLPEREPQYAGRSVSQWLALAATHEGASPQEIAALRAHALQALVQLGARVVPLAVAWATTEDSRPAENVGGWKRGVRPASVPPLSAEARRVAGIQLLRKLGPAARSAVPGLVQKAANQERPMVRWAALEALGQMGANAAEATPLLLPLLDHPDPINGKVLTTLGEIGQQADRVVPRLLADLAGPQRLPPVEVAYALAGFREGRAVPALTRLATGAEEAVAVNALFALARLGPEAIPAITIALTNHQKLVQLAAFTALAWNRTNAFADASRPLSTFRTRFGHEVMNFQAADPLADGLATLWVKPRLGVPLLIANLQETNSAVRVLTARLLAQCGTNAAPAIPILRKLVAEKDAVARQAAATALRQIDPSWAD